MGGYGNGAAAHREPARSPCLRLGGLPSTSAIRPWPPAFRRSAPSLPEAKPAWPVCRRRPPRRLASKFLPSFRFAQFLPLGYLGQADTTRCGWSRLGGGVGRCGLCGTGWRGSRGSGPIQRLRQIFIRQGQLGQFGPHVVTAQNAHRFEDDLIFGSHFGPHSVAFSKMRRGIGANLKLWLEGANPCFCASRAPPSATRRAPPQQACDLRNP